LAALQLAAADDAGKYSALQAQYNQLAHGAKSLRDEHETLRKQVSWANMERDSSNTMAENLRMTNANLEKEFRGLQETHEQTRAEVFNHEIANDKFKQQMAMLQNQVEQLKAAVRSSEEACLNAAGRQQGAVEGACSNDSPVTQSQLMDYGRGLMKQFAGVAERRINETRQEYQNVIDDLHNDKSDLETAVMQLQGQMQDLYDQMDNGPAMDLSDEVHDMPWSAAEASAQMLK